MGSDHVHSSAFSGSGNPVSAFWVSVQQPITPVKRRPTYLQKYNIRGPGRKRLFSVLVPY